MLQFLAVVQIRMVSILVNLIIFDKFLAQISGSGLSQFTLRKFTFTNPSEDLPCLNRFLRNAF